MAMEQRKHRRYRFHCEIWFPGKQVSVTGTASDLSVRGCKVESKKRVYIGKCLALQICLPDQVAPLVVDQAVVRWSRGLAFGVEFLAMQLGEQERLHRFVSTLETQPGH